jgi:uncharacterized membrane protein
MTTHSMQTGRNPNADRIVDTQNRFEKRISSLLLLSSFAACSLLVYRLAATGSFYYFFLPWNLFLAWIPYLISIGFRRLSPLKANKLKIITIFCTWIIFLPNSPYLLTDLVHLAARPGIPLWYDALLVILFAWTGLLLGLISMANAHHYIRNNFQEWIARLVMLFIITLCSFGIYVGRVLRWNSWDLIVQPLALMKDIAAQFLHPFHHQQTFGMTFSFSVFLALCYYTLQAFSTPLKDDQATR